MGKNKFLFGIRNEPFPHKVACEKCGWLNDVNHRKARCKCCGILLNEKERFKEKMALLLKNNVW